VVVLNGRLLFDRSTSFVVVVRKGGDKGEGGGMEGGERERGKGKIGR